MKTLKEIYKQYTMPDAGGDKGTAHTYIDVYEELLKPYRQDGSILEIGIYYGHSLQMWREYFINGIVAGVDIEIKNQANFLLSDDRYKIFIDDATKPKFFNELNGMNFDVIVDDGSHNVQDQIDSFNLLKKCINPGGIYIIEDISDLNATYDLFLALHADCKIYDRRRLKGRWDDVLVVYNF